MGAGQRNVYVEILVREAGRDAANQPKAGVWGTLRTAWASVLHQSGAQAIRSDAPASVVKASIRIPWCVDVVSGMRLRDGDRVYQVQAVLPDRQKRKHVDLVCEMVMSHG